MGVCIVGGVGVGVLIKMFVGCCVIGWWSGGDYCVWFVMVGNLGLGFWLVSELCSIGGCGKCMFW